MDFGQGALISGAMSMLGNYQNYQYQKNLASLQNQFNLDMWKMQADYNSPQAQMERYKAAGLNPNLIYGQGSNGNMQTAPQMVTPNAPDYSEGMGKMGEGIGRLFNIENIRILRAQRKKAEADASSAQVDAQRNEMQFDADMALGALYHFDDSTGRYVLNPTEGYYGIEKYKASDFYRMKALAENYNKNFLLPTRNKLTTSEDMLLQPQIRMSHYESRFKPYSFWIGQGSKVLNALPLPRFSFGRQTRNFNYNY